MSYLFLLSCFLLGLASLLSFFRIIKGPVLADRVVAMDLITNIFIAVTVLLSIHRQQTIYLDIVVILALVIFLTTTMYARFIEKTVERDASHAHKD